MVSMIHDLELYYDDPVVSLRRMIIRFSMMPQVTPPFL